MATKWKKYEGARRVIAIVLAFLSAFSAALFGYLSLRNAFLFDTGHSETFYQTPFFENLTVNAASAVFNYGHANNSAALQEKQEKKQAYEDKRAALMQEQSVMEVRLDQLIWLQNNLPDGADPSFFDAYLFVNCSTPEEYASVMQEICDNNFDTDVFLRLVQENADLPDINFTFVRPDASTTTVLPDTPVRSSVPATSSVQATSPVSDLDIPNTAVPLTNHAEPPTVSDPSVPATIYAEPPTEFSEEDGSSVTLNPSGYQAELSGWQNSTIWLYYYYKLRTYLVSKVGTPVYSEAVYNWASDNLSRYNSDNYTESYEYAAYLPSVRSLSYFYYNEDTGEYLTNIKEYMNGSADPVVQKDENAAALFQKVQSQASQQPWTVTFQGDEPITLNDRTTILSEDKTPGEKLVLFSSITEDSPDRQTDVDLLQCGYAAYENAEAHGSLYLGLFILCLALFCLNALYILTAGTRRLVATDKLYNDWHFLLSAASTAGCAVGAVLLLSVQPLLTQHADIGIFDRAEQLLLALQELAIPVLTGGVLLFLLEYLTSVIRSARSHRLISHSCWYAIGAACRRKIRALKNRDQETYGHMRKPLHTFFLLCVGCLFLSILLFCVTYQLVSTSFWMLVFLFSLLPLAALLAVVAIYMRSLDQIIEAASKIRQGDYSVTIRIEQLPRLFRPFASDILYNRDGMKNAIEQSVRDERMKAELITNVSHDLKTPLTSIVTYVDLLKKSEIEDERARLYVGIIEEKADKLKQLIEDLTEVSKASTGNIRLEKMKIDLYELAVQAIGEHSDALSQKGIELIINEKTAPVNIWADSRQTWRIIDNLFSNIKKYAMPSTRVYIDVREEGGKGVFVMKNVSQQPLNLPAEELTRRFVRGDESRTTDGSGLGLSIAQSLCELQNGTFRIEIDGDLFKATVILPKAYDGATPPQ